MSNLAWALSYQRRGWSVVPAHSPDPDGVCSCTRIDCRAPAKHPRVQWTQYQSERPTESQVRQWWHRWPDANVAIITGAVSNLVVLDIDPRHGGEDSLVLLKQGMAPTVTCLTGGGGEHYYFAYPGTAVRNGANLLPGVDLRGEGGYVIAPASRHVSGGEYVWEGGYGPDEHPLAAFPANILGLLTEAKPTLEAAVADDIDISAYVSGARQIPEGERNVQMTRVVGHLLGNGMSAEYAWPVLLAVNQQACQPPLAEDELKAIFRSIHSREERRKAALAQVEQQVTAERAALLPNGDRLELARALWAQIGVPDVVDWIRVVGPDTTDYQLELPDRVANLGTNLLGGFQKLRDSVLNATGRVIPRFKTSDWERYAEQLARLAREEQIGPLRQVDLVAEWTAEYAAIAQDYPPEQRRDALRSNPILYDGRLATKTRRFLTFLEGAFAEKLTSRELGRVLTLSGWRYVPIWIGDGTTKVWVSPPLAEEVPRQETA